MKVINRIAHNDGSIEKHYDNGTIAWYKNDEVHREGGPAVEFSHGTKKWLINGKHHREDGPAIEHSDGINEWYLNGKSLSEKEFNTWKLEKELNKELAINNNQSKKLKL